MVLLGIVSVVIWIDIHGNALLALSKITVDGNY